MDYLVPFISGGVTVAAIKYLGNFASPSTAAVIGVFPIGLISSVFIDDVNRLRLYLYNYQFMIICLACGTVSYRLLIESGTLTRSQALFVSLMLWASLGMLMKLLFLKDGIVDVIAPPPGGKPPTPDALDGWARAGSFSKMKMKVAGQP